MYEEKEVLFLSFNYLAKIQINGGLYLAGVRILLFGVYVKYKSKAASPGLAVGNCLMQLYPLFLFLFLTAVFKC